MNPSFAYRHRPGWLESTLLLPSTPEEVFAFLSDPRNLDRATPPWFRVRILSPLPPALGEGLEIRYGMRIRGVPVRWTSRITEWEPPVRFTYLQLQGPYRAFRHIHLFRAAGSGCEAVDRVEYAVPGGGVVDRLLVARELERIFRHRAAILPGLLAGGPGNGLDAGTRGTPGGLRPGSRAEEQGVPRDDGDDGEDGAGGQGGSHPPAC